MPDEYLPMVGRDRYIHTFTGGRFNYSDPGSCIHINDMAHSLSNICRWTGHVRFHYSVAQHLVLCSKQGVTCQQYKLLHDGSEAWTGDVNKPLKTLLGPVFDEIEERIQNAVWDKFGLPHPDKNLHHLIKQTDHEVALAEAKQLMGLEMSIPGVRPAYIKIEQWSPEEAEQAFLDRFMELW